MTAGRSSCADAFRARNDSIRVLYEDTPVPVREIARLVGVTERDIYALVRRLDCRPRLRLADDGRRIVPPAAQMACGLDSESVQRAVQRCADAVAYANGSAARSLRELADIRRKREDSGQRDKARAATQTALSMAADARVADRSLGEAPGLATNSSLRRGARARCGPRRPACPHPHLVLRLGLPLQVRLAIGLLQLGQFGSRDQIPDQHLALGLLVGTLNHRTRAAAAVGVAKLLTEVVVGTAKIKLGADAGVPQRRDQLLIVRRLAVAEHRDQHRPGRRLGVELADHCQRGLQPRHADGEAGRRNGLAAEARHQTVVAPAAADRAEANGAAFLVFGFEQKFYFVDGAGVVLEAADDGGIELYSTIAITCGANKSWISFSSSIPACHILDASNLSPNIPRKRFVASYDRIDGMSTRHVRLSIAKSCSFCEIATLVLAARTEQ